MKDFQFVMITKWKNHWDKLYSGRTHFTNPLIYLNQNTESIEGDVETLFIKQGDNNTFEKSWIGKTCNFKKEEYKISFEVKNLESYDKPCHFNVEKLGWYQVEGGYFSKSKNIYEPDFFKAMEKTTSAKEFEEYCFYLLKLIGIHNIHKIIDQAGRSDGFIVHGQLFAFYDATLNSDFVTYKEDQLDNFAGQLTKESIQFDGDRYTIRGNNRQVWVITRGARVREIRRVDGIKILEIPFYYFVRLYNQRLLLNLDGDDFFNRLANPLSYPF